jgi:hypothetical protein
VKVVTYEAVVENGQIKLRDAVLLPERAKVYVVVPDDQGAPLRVTSPRLADPQRAAEFIKEVIEDRPDAGLR